MILEIKISGKNNFRKNYLECGSDPKFSDSLPLDESLLGFLLPIILNTM